VAAALRVFLIYDHQMMADAIAAGLAATPAIWVLGRCPSDDPRLSDIVARARPDVVTLEVESLGVSAGRVIDRIHVVLPAVRIVVLTATSEQAVPRAGADAWLSMDNSLERLAAVLQSMRAGVARCPQALGVREREVRREMMEGRTGREIAQRLYPSADTVRTHVRAILVKLDVPGRLGTVAVAREDRSGPWRAAGPAGHCANDLAPDPGERSIVHSGHITFRRVIN
jgi:DNA-binding NarL/FixJ family response regulator